MSGPDTAFERRRVTRARTLEALTLEDDPKATAKRLARASVAVRSDVATGDDTREGFFRRNYAEALNIAAMLNLWDASIRQADFDADRHLRAAQRRLETIRLYRNDPLFEPLNAALTSIAAVASPRDVRVALEALARVPVPLQLLDRWRERRHGRRPIGERHVERPLVVCMFEIDGAVVTHPHVIHLNRVYEVCTRTRVTDWPEWASSLRLEFLSVLSPDDLSLPVFEMLKPSDTDPSGANRIWSLAATGSLVLRVAQAPGAAPWRPRVAASFIAPARIEAARVAGYTELRLRAFDESRDRLTGRASIDERLLSMYGQLWGTGIPDAEIAAFCRFFTAISLAAQAIQADRAYGEGKRLSEAAFHDDLERRLRSDATLGGRLERRTPAGGGYLDLLHDGINAELKVENDKPASVEGAAKYMGQPVQYATDRGSQLSILCVLDRSAKRAPVGELPNYFGWLIPALHGLDDVRYPSRVGTIIINANLPMPSQWSRRPVPRARQRGARPQLRASVSHRCRWFKAV
ncbi:MAG: hypothetical protein ABSA52_15970 [Candidatus Binatia bacterium]|jgi:hypothetical protein